MSLVVCCPACTKKLHVRDTLHGRRIKCTCGHTFTPGAPSPPAPPPPAPAPPASPEVVIVSCLKCGARLRSPTDLLGRKMKCPRCRASFRLTGGTILALVRDAAVAAALAPPTPV